MRSFSTGLEALLEKVAMGQLELPHVGPYRAPAAPPALPQGAPPARPGLLRRAAGPLGLAGLAGAGALAAGLGSQYEDDRKKYPLVYAPLAGAY